MIRTIRQTLSEENNRRKIGDLLYWTVDKTIICWNIRRFKAYNKLTSIGSKPMNIESKQPT